MAEARMNIGAQTRATLAAGDQAELLRTMAQMANDWFLRAGSHIRCRNIVPTVQCSMDREKGVLLAAALDLVTVLELSPQGRETILELFGEPLPQKSKAPGG